MDANGKSPARIAWWVIWGISFIITLVPPVFEPLFASLMAPASLLLIGFAARSANDRLKSLAAALAIVSLLLNIEFVRAYLVAAPILDPPDMAFFMAFFGRLIAAIPQVIYLVVFVKRGSASEQS